MTALELEAEKARLAHAILSIDNACLLAEVKKYLSHLLNQDTSTETGTSGRRPVSAEVLDLVIGEIPDDMDTDKETDKMWEELAG